MLLEMLIIFIIIAVILFIISVLFMDESPMIAIPIIFVGMIFSILCSYGLFDVGTLYLGQNITTGAVEPMIYSNESYGVGYPWVFFFMFILFAILFVKVGFNLVMDARTTRGEIEYNMNRGRRR